MCSRDSVLQIFIDIPGILIYLGKNISGGCGGPSTTWPVLWRRRACAVKNMVLQLCPTKIGTTEAVQGEKTAKSPLAFVCGRMS